MTMSTAPAAGTGWGRPILLVSLALNLFFVGIAGAMAWRHVAAGAPAASTETSRAPAARIERLAVLLPAADAEKLRAQFQAQEAAIDAAHEAYLRSRDTVGGALRADPFSIDKLRAAMSQVRASRQLVDEAMQDVVASASGKMSSEGRGRLADRASNSRTGNGPGR